MRPTDNDRFLAALERSYPDPVWDPNSTLNITAHSRASELRKQGHDIRACRLTDPQHPKGVRHGYRLVKREALVTDAAGTPVLFDGAA